MEQVESIDTEIQPQIGVSLLSDRLILEALVCLTIALRNFPLVKALTASGSPSPEEETRFLWNWREAITKADGICDSSTTTVLLRHRWLKMKDAYADQIPTILDEEMVIDRIDALLEVGYSFIPAPTDPLQAKYYHLLLQEISHERIPILRHLLSRAPIPNTVSMYNSLLTEAASRVKDGVAIIELLLEQGLDIDGRQQSTDGSYDTTLHVAIRVGCIQNVECLLRHGARMLQDAGGRMPLELAEHLHHSEIVRVLKYHLQMNE
ncbi:hypothetical protein F5884DRAFT_446090 [Xylogone sp. PMI_703]|nr:hypothetical protein F5884DRAFT_446090 [Xylogone sp. PMI_703]